MEKNSNQQEIIIKNLDAYTNYMNSITRNKEKVERFLQELYDSSFPTAPASTRTEYTSCYPGGLLEHSLRTMLYAARLRKVYSLENQIDQTSIILTALCHDIGKGLNSYYTQLPASDWRVNRFSQHYEIKPELSYYPVSQLSLMFLVGEHGFSLTKEEWNAISSIRDTKNPMGEDHVAKGEPPLTMILQQAVRASCHAGKNMEKTSAVFVTDKDKQG